MRCLAVFVLSFALSAAASAKSLESVSDDLMHFYQVPTAARFVALQADVEEHKDELGAATGNPGLLIAVAFARVAEKHGWPLANGAYAVVASEILDGQTALAKYVADDTLVDAMKLDVWWASYFATGETTYLKKLVEQANAPASDVAARAAVTAAAKWSLKSNCHAHTSIAAYMKRAGQPGC